MGEMLVREEAGPQACIALAVEGWFCCPHIRSLPDKDTHVGKSLRCHFPALHDHSHPALGCIWRVTV